MSTPISITDAPRHYVQFGKERISFQVLFSRHSGLAITVHPDQSVTVRAPQGRTIDEVKARVKRRAPWIKKQQYYFDQFAPLPVERQFVSGETHWYLGRQYRLKIVESTSEHVKLRGRYLWVQTKDREKRDRVKQQVQAWYREHAVALIEDRIEHVRKQSAVVHIPVSDIRIRRMAKRWGSCAKSGTITLNTELVKAPIQCIDYVIAHELCHLKHKNHSPAFWRLLSRLMPDWEARKKRLERAQI